MKPSPLSILALSMLSAISAWSVENQEKELSEKDVPPAVLKTMQTTAAEGTKLGEFESEMKGGKPVFTATFRNQAKVEMEITVDPDGKLLSVTKEDDEDTGGKHDDEAKDGKKPTDK